MGQRFLSSRAVLQKIIAAADLAPTDTVLEIGPGLGILTFELARRAGKVIAVEKDRRLAGELRGELARRGIRNAEVIEGDILKLFPDHLPIPISRLAPHTSPYRVVANIPYYVTSRLIRRLLEAKSPPQEILLMVQREVAERIVAAPPRMNLLAIAVQAYGRPEIVAAVPRSAFRPAPRVDSALLRISEISDRFFAAHGVRPEHFFAIARRAFSQKRKTLANSLAGAFGGKTEAVAALAQAGIASGTRPAELPLDQWVRLVRRMGPF